MGHVPSYIACEGNKNFPARVRIFFRGCMKVQPGDKDLAKRDEGLEVQYSVPELIVMGFLIVLTVYLDA